MCGIAGFADFENNVSKEHEILNAMNEALAHRGPDASGIWLCKEAAIAHKRLAVIDPVGGVQPMIRSMGRHKYIITYNGELYNTKELKYELEHLGHVFTTESDTEVVLAAYIQWKEGCLSRLNGIFAFGVWSEKDKSLFLARDRFGVKPLFYTQVGSCLIFGSEIKALLAHPSVDAAVDNVGIAEVFGLGPCRTPGVGVFKDIYELKPAHYMRFNAKGLSIKRYWEFVSEEHTDSLANTAEKVRYLVRDSITRQLVSDVPLCTLLSGGLDSSAITAIAAGQYAFERGERIDTYSFEFKDDDRFFRKNIFQPDSDKKWVERMCADISSRHRTLVADTDIIINALEDSVCARDLPGMADIDSSLLYYCKQIKKRHTVALSGECADEIFGGYPWFHSQKAFETPMFPWQYSTDERSKILNSDMAFYADIDGYVARRYFETIEKTPRLSGENGHEARRREIFYLNITWFMTQLLERKDRMSMASGLEIRVPFCDHRLAEYVWNIPWNMKTLGGREKGILRLTLKGILPDDVIERKKSPYPKTHNPSYEAKVKEILTEILNDSTSPILEIVDKNQIERLMEQPSDISSPFFGQLMSAPQLFGYLIQVNMWLKKYKISIR
ncbi:MAG: Asparagine synthetase (glutamine-hydrolyzing) 3 [Firmicutes bacterium ADurb.Bin193]|nr:MAG: Asparagine synthetase (glutamine-hydrolyzing) 3 [Firmicutes bacterium ADurb.Bin193]